MLEAEISRIPGDWPPSSSPIQQFFKDANILITGGTGFLGKILIEKLLRCCSDFNTIYLLIREKKGKSVDLRTKELFGDEIFKQTIEENPKCISKIFIVPGDCSLPDLGLSTEHQKLLSDKVNIVFHGAATVRFDENLKVAVGINVFGTQEILRFCKTMNNLKSVVHISTAYTNCPQSTIEEQVYEPPSCHSQLIELSKKYSAQDMAAATPSLLERWPNTYTLTKNVAEYLVKSSEGVLPVCIFRPAIVTSTCYEPLKGWIDNLYGPTGIVVGAGCGVVRTLQCDLNVEANIVPVDLVVNAIIASANETYRNFKNGQKEIKVYNYISSTDNPLSYKDFMNLIRKHGILIPPKRAIWYYSFISTKSRYVNLLLTLLLHFIPALLMDAGIILVGKKPMMVKIYKKIYKFSRIIAYFSMRSWNFKNENVKSLWLSMAEKDRILFNFDIKAVDWDQYLSNYIKGARVYFLKDDMSSLPEARKKWNRLWWCHQAVKMIFSLLFLRLVWTVLTNVLGLLSSKIY